MGEKIYSKIFGKKFLKKELNTFLNFYDLTNKTNANCCYYWLSKTDIVIVN